MVAVVDFVVVFVFAFVIAFGSDSSTRGYTTRRQGEATNGEWEWKGERRGRRKGKTMRGHGPKF